MNGKLVDIVLTSEQYDGSAARVLKWLVSVGEAVEANQPLVEIETDKVTVEVASPVSGILSAKSRADDEATQTGDVLGRIQVGAAGPGATRAAATAGAGEQRLSPAVRKLLSERGLDATAVTGTGHDGRVTAADVIDYAGPGARSLRVPHSPMRRRIAQNMAHSVATAPHVTAVFEADLSAVAAHRAAHHREFASRGANLTFTAYFLAACVPALRAVPAVNSRFHADALEIFEDCNIGVATALGDEGLVVPVLRHVQDLDLFGIAHALGPMIEAARRGRLQAKDMQGGTFTISNHGVSGSLIAAPVIINQPQCAVLGVGKLERRPSVVIEAGEEEVCIRSKCYVSLTIDHRAIDGFQANRFLAALVDRLQRWPGDAAL